MRRIKFKQQFRAKPNKSNDAIVDNWQPTALFNSLAGSWSERDGLLSSQQQDEISFSSLDGDVKGPITLAVALQRNRAEHDASDGQAGKGQQRVVITGDSDFLSDTYIGAGANLNLGLNIFNLYLMLPVGIICYFLTNMGYPIAPLVIGVILGPMADENLRRALMVSQGSFMPVFQRPVSLILFIIIVLTVVSQFDWYRKAKDKALQRILSRRNTCETILEEDESER